LELWGLSTKTIQANLWQTLDLDYHKIINLTHKLNELSIGHASALIKKGMHCNITQATTVKG
jgi:hypothetical protein